MSPLPQPGGVEPSTPLHDVAFTVVDLETTGGSPGHVRDHRGRGGCGVRAGRRDRELATLVRPSATIPRSITGLTGISDGMVADAPPIGAVLPMLLEVLRGSVLVAHSARFDVSFLDAALRDHGYPPLDLPVVCTATLARRLVRDEVRNCRLATLSAYFRTSTPPSHRGAARRACDRRGAPRPARTRRRPGGDHVGGAARAVSPSRRRDGVGAHAPGRSPADDAPASTRSAPAPVRCSTWARRSTCGPACAPTSVGDPRRMVRRLVHETARIDHRTCPTEIEAQVREVRAIARWRPRYNRRGYAAGPGGVAEVDARALPAPVHRAHDPRRRRHLPRPAALDAPRRTRARCAARRGGDPTLHPADRSTHAGAGVRPGRDGPLCRTVHRWTSCPRTRPTSSPRSGLR